MIVSIGAFIYSLTSKYDLMLANTVLWDYDNFNIAFGYSICLVLLAWRGDGSLEQILPVFPAHASADMANHI